MAFSFRSCGLLAAVVWFGLTCGPGAAAVGDPPAVPVSEIIGAAPRDIAGETRLYCLALAVYFEGGSTVETEEGQRHIARVVAERAKANRRIWGGADICDVVFYKRGGVCQFSFACLPSARRTPRGGAAWTYSVAIAQDELAGRSDVQERLTRYYMNPALTPDRNICRFKKEFVPVLEAGRHHFFREPTAAESAELARSEPVECIRWAEAVAAKKRQAEARRIAKVLARAIAKRKQAAANVKNQAKNKNKKLKYAKR